jgi:ADP-ribosyl-[dinitrogen reductase] hydrolase
VTEKDREDAIVGTLLGTALGDALGLPCEGMGPKAIARRFGRVDRFTLLGSTGFVSDDTEQSALIAQAILRGDSVASSTRAFRRSILGWFGRLPWGVGLGTIRACVKIALGFRTTGVFSAGNGAAMRAAVVGAAFPHDQERRLSYGKALAEVTHRDARAVDGALYVAELAALSVAATSTMSRAALATRALSVVHEPSLNSAISEALSLAEAVAGVREAAEALGTTGFVLHTVPFAAFCFTRFGNDVLASLTGSISAGGDTDSIAAILGGWLGALHGAEALPRELLGKIHDGPFGPTHLRALGRALARGETVPKYSALRALLRNLALYPVILAHGFRRLIPF